MVWKQCRQVSMWATLTLYLPKLLLQVSFETLHPHLLCAPLIISVHKWHYLETWGQTMQEKGNLVAKPWDSYQAQQPLFNHQQFTLPSQQGCRERKGDLTRHWPVWDFAELLWPSTDRSCGCSKRDIIKYIPHFKLLKVISVFTFFFFSNLVTCSAKKISFPKQKECK